MRSNRDFIRGQSVIRVISIVSIMVAIVFSGCITEDDDDDGQCGPPPLPEDRVYLIYEHVIQSDVDCWDTNITIGANFDLSDLANHVDDVSIVITNPQKAILTDARWTYHDLDANGLMSVLDVIEITNMTEEYQESSLSLNNQWGVRIAWDEENTWNLVLFDRGEYSESDEGLWTFYFNVHLLNGKNPLDLSRLTIAIQKDENTLLTNANISINDKDKNGVLSVKDRIEISNMTEKYRGATVRMICEDIQIGYKTIPNFR